MMFGLRACLVVLVGLKRRLLVGLEKVPYVCKYVRVREVDGVGRRGEVK